MDLILLSPRQVHELLGIGVTVSRQLCALMPHITVGQRGTGQQLRVRREHIEALVSWATDHHVDLWTLVRTATPAEIAEYIRTIEALARE